MDLNPNRRMKEEFVSNLTGSTLMEIAALSTIVPGLVVLRKWYSSDRLNDEEMKGKNVKLPPKDIKSHLTSTLSDYIFVILPILLFFTVLADWSYYFTVFLIFLIFLTIASKRFKFHSKLDEEKNDNNNSLRRIISSYRVSVVVITCLCILAVDFNIFPRKFAKTETYGSSLMDLGVGSFVVANALVSKQARNIHSMNLKNSIKSISPLILLGFGRLISTTGVDYQVHIGEYGVHWNFFFTLSGVSILTSFFQINPKFCGILGFLILSGYQTVLKLGLNEYLISNNREENLISQNKEGIFSLFGYWAMYLIGVYFGNILFINNNQIISQKIKIFGLSAFFWLVTIILDSYIERVSRRMCNMAYVTNVFAQNFQVLSVLTLADKNLIFEEAFNQNLLGSFLMANIFTGAVNLSIDTLSVSNIIALIIMIIYSFILCLIVSLASFFGFRVKFW